VNRYSTPTTTAPAPAESWMHESRSPAMPSRFETHVLVPVVLAGVVALAMTLGLVIGAWRFGWPWDVTWIGGLVAFIAMLAWRLLWVDHLSWRLETITGRELDGVPGIGKPEHPFVLQNQGEARNQADKLAAHVWRESRAAELVRFAAACAVDGTSEAAQGISSKSQRDKYVERRDALFDLGLAAWKNPAVPNSAWVLRLPPEQTAEIIESYVK
jgi:hypothetical protein